VLPKKATVRCDYLFLYAKPKLQNALFKSSYKFVATCQSTRCVLRLGDARGKKQVWRPHVRTWGLSEAKVLEWRKFLRNFWDFLAPH